MRTVSGSRGRRGGPRAGLASALLASALLVGPAAAQPAPPPRPGAPSMLILQASGPCDGTAPTRSASRGGGGQSRREEIVLGEYSRERMEIDAVERLRRAEVPLTRPAGWLGVSTVDVSDLRWTRDGRMVRYCAYPVVVSVEPGSPADEGGLVAGDTIVAYAGRDLLKGGELALDRLLVPGETVRVTVRREGRTLMRPVVVGQRPTTAFFRSVPLDRDVRVMRTASGGTVITTTIRGSAAGGGPNDESPRPPRPVRISGTMTPTAAPAPPTVPLPPATIYGPADAPAPRSLPPVPFTIGFGGASVIVGAQVVTMDDDLREAMGGDDAGLLVVRVLPGTPAAAAGLRAGDVITRAGDAAVVTPNALHRAVMRGTDARTVVLRIERRGKGKELTVRW